VLATKTLSRGFVFSQSTFHVVFVGFLQDEQTALHLSSRLGDENTVRLLMQHSADVDSLMRDNYTPLHIAVKHQHLDVIDLLLSNAAKLDQRSQVCTPQSQPRATPDPDSDSVIPACNCKSISIECLTIETGS